MRLLTVRKTRPRILLVGFSLKDLPFEKQYVYGHEPGIIADEFGYTPKTPPSVEAVTWSGHSERTLYDYDVVVMNQATYSECTATKMKQLDEFLQTEDGGLLILFCSTPTLQSNLSSLIPLGVRTLMIPEFSEEYALRSHDMLSWPFKFYAGQGFYFDGVFPKDSQIIAVNKKGKALSFHFRRGKGQVVLWPEIKEKKDALKFVLDHLVPELISVPQPPWLDEVAMHDEKVLQAQVLDSQRKIDSYQRWKILLYGTGSQLRQVVKEALNFLGVKAADPAQQYDHDLEVDLPEAALGIVEVTGSTGPIDIDKVRQLLDFVLAVEKEQPKKRTKGILIANPQRETPPKKRDCDFTEKSVERAQMNSLCLYTTTQLYESLESFLKGEKVAERLAKTLLETNGTCAN